MLKKDLIILSTISVIFTLIFFFHVIIRKPFDGDSFEYAGIARNIYRGLGLQEHLLRNYTVKDQPLPHPSAQRANLFPFVLVPFYAIFKDSILTFAVPSLIAYAVLPLVAYLVGLKFFGAKVAFIAAILTFFHPRFLYSYTFDEPGLPEVFQMIFFLYATYFCLKGRYFHCGVFVGLSFLMKQNGIVLIPAFFLWVFIFKHSEIKKFHFWGLILAVIIMLLPLFIRNFIVFKNPFYTEQFQGLTKAYSEGETTLYGAGKYLALTMNYEEFYKNSSEYNNKMSFLNFLKNLKHVVSIITKDLLFGVYSDVWYRPGLFQLISLMLVFFFPIGIFFAFSNKEQMCFLFVIFFHLIFHTLIAPYMDRYMFPILPFLFYFAGSGLMVAVKKTKIGSIPVVVVTFLLITETLPIIFLQGMTIITKGGGEVYDELESVCGWMKSNVPKESVIMTFPIFSTHFVCDRMTVPFPYGTIDSITEIVEKYKVKYVIFANLWKADKFPYFEFFKPTFLGKSISVFEVDSNSPHFKNLDNKYSYMKNLNFMDYFIENKFNIEFLPPLYKVFCRLLNSVWLGILIYILFFCGFYFVFSMKLKIIKLLILIILSIVLSLFQMWFMGENMIKALGTQKNISIIQLTNFIKFHLKGESEPEIIFVGNEKDYKAELVAIRENFQKVFISKKLLKKDKVNTFTIYPISEDVDDLSGKNKLMSNFVSQREKYKEIEKEKRFFSSRGWSVERIYGALIGY